LATTRAELAAALAGRAGEIGVVMTLGALHDGHAALLHAARARSEIVVATIFVNPLQFGPGEDFDRYPRTLDTDLALCESAGADVVFAPPVDEVYPDGAPTVTIAPGPLAEVLEGASRPGHFAGVLTVVSKMLHIVSVAAGRLVDATFFGEKDYQQLTLVRQMVRDLDLGVEIVTVETVREDDGLARSSRNRYLSPDERRSALALSAALRAGIRAGAQGGDAALAAARAVIAGEPGVTLDYLALATPGLGPAPAEGLARMLVAATVGKTRLIDNSAVWLGSANEQTGQEG
jgi:pantoate--beta-alanine ligase